MVPGRPGFRPHHASGSTARHCRCRLLTAWPGPPTRDHSGASFAGGVAEGGVTGSGTTRPGPTRYEGAAVATVYRLPLVAPPDLPDKTLIEQMEVLRERTQALRLSKGLNDSETVTSLIELRGVQERLFSLASEARGRDDPTSLYFGALYAKTLFELDDVERAVSLQRDVVNGIVRTSGEIAKESTTAMEALGVMLQTSGDLVELHAVRKRLLDAYREQSGRTSTEAMRAALALANTSRILVRFEQAVPLYRFVIDHADQVLGDFARESITARVDLAGVLLAQGQLQQALKFLYDAQGRARSSLSVGDELRVTIENNLAAVGALQHTDSPGWRRWLRRISRALGIG